MNDHFPPDALKARTLLVTGATEGIGREAALTYARLGARLLLLGRNAEKLQQVASEIAAARGAPAHCFILDMDSATPERCQRLAQEIAAVAPQLDGVLHNAGVLGEVVPMREQTPAVWQQVMRVNVDSTFFLTQALLPLLLAAPQASLVFTSSSVGRQGRAGWGAYAVSKFATEGMMQVLAEEYRGSGLRVNCINPGGTRTAMRASAFPDENRDRLKTPAEIMAPYVWLMSAASRDVHGQSIDAQPGRKAGPAE
ncbi:YciK family oxidoreductase [Pantoea sp. 1.19]|uniref:YciK family oxidoreductase n=1 Tax=Pantoea sp. 1.19 TaxID=1925589 RepID=UPI0009490698|nr:YciK family oxidoreductase [Pantoea sp. 1.19]